MAAESVVCHSIWPKFKNIQDIMHFLLICKFKRDQTNSNRQKVEILIFLAIQGQLTLTSVVGSGRNSMSPKLLWLSLLPFRMKKKSLQE